MRFPKIIITLLSIGFMSISYTTIWDTETKSEATPSIRDIYNGKMCGYGERNNLSMEDILDKTEPLTFLIDTKWQTKLNITTKNEKAKAFFNQGLFYLYSFNHAEAERSFKEGIRLDPNCAMCHWGVALGLGPNINRSMPIDHIAEAYEYAQKAKELSINSTDMEKELIYALSTRYTADTLENRSALDSTYAAEMRLVTQRHRDDMDIATLFVESLMDRMPWKYWLPNDQPKPATREALAVLDYVIENDPTHPGANHLYIHLVEEVHPYLGVHSADVLHQMDFPTGHLVHMPSHIYIRTGKYHEASIANEKAIDLDEKYIEQCNIEGIYPAVYYPHNIHFLWYATSMEGRSEANMEAAKKLVAQTPENMIWKVPSLERYYATPLFSMVRFGKWDKILNEKQPKKDLVYTNYMWHYARGMAYVHKQQKEKAEAELTILSKGIKDKDLVEVNSPFYPVTSMITMAKLVLSSEIDKLDGKQEQSIAQLRKAIDIQDSLIYDEPPHFYFPIRQALGNALLENKDYHAAEIAYGEDLAMFPDNGWSLWGLYRCMKEQNKMKEVKEIKSKFDKAWKRADVRL